MDGYDGAPRRELDEARHRALVAVLDRLRAEHRARLVFLAAACGRPLAVSGSEPGPDLDAVSSLIASASAAAGQLARLLGEGSTDLLIQRGERDVLQLVPAQECVLAVVFNGDAPHGLERLRARLRQRRALGEIAAILGEENEDTAPGAVLAGCEESEIDELLGPIEAGACPDAT